MHDATLTSEPSSEPGTAAGGPALEPVGAAAFASARQRPRVRRRLVALVAVPALLLAGAGTAELLRHGADGAGATSASRGGRASGGTVSLRTLADTSAETVTDLPPVSDAAFATDLAGSATDGAADPAPEAKATKPATAKAPKTAARKSTGVTAKDVAAALARRTTALRRHDEKAFLATFDPARPKLVATERILFRNLVKLPLVTPVYLDAAAGGTATAKKFYVALVHQVDGVDAEPTTLTKIETWVRRNGVVVTTLVAPVAGQSATRYAPLDQAPLAVVSGPRVTVVGTSDVKNLAQISATAEDAAGAVRDLWGSRPGPTRFIIFVTHNRHAIGTWFGARGTPIEAMAATMPQLALYHPTKIAGARVIVDLSVTAPGEELFRTLRHEFTHAVDVRLQVLSASGDGPAMPIWTEEGLASWVEEQDLPIEKSVYAGDLRMLRSYWNHKLPPTSRAEFYASSLERANFNYDLAAMIFRYIATHWDDDRAIAFYSYLASGRTDAASHVLDVDQATFTRDWGAWVDSTVLA